MKIRVIILFVIPLIMTSATNMPENHGLTRSTEVKTEVKADKNLSPPWWLIIGVSSWLILDIFVATKMYQQSDD